MLLVFSFVLVLGGMALQLDLTAEVTTAPFPPEISHSPDYLVQADGKEVSTLGTPAFSLATFAFTSESEIMITVGRPVRKVIVRPLSLGIEPIVHDQAIRFRLRQPCHLSVEVNDELRHHS